MGNVENSWPLYPRGPPDLNDVKVDLHDQADREDKPAQDLNDSGVLCVEPRSASLDDL